MEIRYKNNPKSIGILLKYCEKGMNVRPIRVPKIIKKEIIK